VDYEKLSRDRGGESSEAIRIHLQAADMHRDRFSSEVVLQVAERRSEPDAGGIQTEIRRPMTLFVVTRVAIPSACWYHNQSDCHFLS
jgi:hypothetical protein